VHQADIGGAVSRGAPVKIDPLQKRTETVPDPDDSDSDFIHLQETSKLAAPACPEQESCHFIAIFAERNPGGEGCQNIVNDRPFPLSNW
jgi:hypothetical protein